MLCVASIAVVDYTAAVTDHIQKQVPCSLFKGSVSNVSLLSEYDIIQYGHIQLVFVFQTQQNIHCGNLHPRGIIILLCLLARLTGLLF